MNLNRKQIKQFSLPKLYATNIVYRAEKGTETWKSAKDINNDGFGDCEDLACYRVAELRNDGIQAKPALKKTGKRRWHAIVLYPSGKIEDPSKILIAREKGKPMSVIQWSVKRPHGLAGRGGYLGEVTVPTGDSSALKTTAIGQTPLQALFAAVTKAQQAVQMPTFPKIPTMPRMPQLPWQTMASSYGTQPFAAMIPFLQAFGLQQQKQQQSATSSFASAIPDSIPGAPPEAQAALKALKVGIKLASHPKVKKAAKKLWRKGKKFGKKLKKLFKLW